VPLKDKWTKYRIKDVSLTNINEKTLTVLKISLYGNRKH